MTVTRKTLDGVEFIRVRAGIVDGIRAARKSSGNQKRFWRDPGRGTWSLRSEVCHHIVLQLNPRALTLLW
jgi:hypothetical protein